MAELSGLRSRGNYERRYARQRQHGLTTHCLNGNYCCSTYPLRQWHLLPDSVSPDAVKNRLDLVMLRVMSTKSERLCKFFCLSTVV